MTQLILRNNLGYPLSNEQMDDNWSFLDQKINDAIETFKPVLATPHTPGVVMVDDTTIGVLDGILYLKDADKFILKPATTSTLGGVKVGSGLTVDLTGTLSIKLGNMFQIDETGNISINTAQVKYTAGRGINISADDVIENTGVVSIVGGTGITVATTPDGVYTVGLSMVAGGGSNGGVLDLTSIIPISGLLTDDSTPIRTDYAGTKYDLSTAAGKFIVFQGTTDVTTITTVTHEFGIYGSSDTSTNLVTKDTGHGLKLQINKTTGEYSAIETSQGSWTSNVETFTLTCTVAKPNEAPVNYSKTYKVYKVKDGALGTPAKFVTIGGNQVFKYQPGSTAPEIQTIELKATLHQLEFYYWQYWNGTAWKAFTTRANNQQTYTVRYDDAEWGTYTTLYLRCQGYSTGDVPGTETLPNDVYTLIKIFDGKNGSVVDNMAVDIVPNRAAAFVLLDGSIKAGQTSIVYEAKLTGVSNPEYHWSFTRTDGSGTTPTIPSTNTRTFTITPENFGNSQSVLVSCAVNPVGSTTSVTSSSTIIAINTLTPQTGSSTVPTTNVVSHNQNRAPTAADGNYGDSWFDQTTQIIYYKFPPDANNQNAGWKKLLINTTNAATYIPNAAIGSAQIGSVAAGAIETGTLTSNRYISIVDTANKEVTRLGYLRPKVINDVVVDTTLTYGLQGWGNITYTEQLPRDPDDPDLGWYSQTVTRAAEVFRIDNRGLDARITTSALEAMGMTYRKRVVLQGAVELTSTVAQTIPKFIDFPITTRGMVVFMVEVTGYYHNLTTDTNHANCAILYNGFSYDRRKMAYVDMGTKRIWQDSTNVSSTGYGTFFPPSKIDIVPVKNSANQVTGLQLKLVSATNQPIGSKTTYTYIIYAIDNEAYPFVRY